MSEPTPDPFTPVGWTSEEAAGSSAQGEAAGQPGTSTRAAFCQDCGTPLTAATARSVGSSTFCEPCLSARIGAAATTAPPRAAVTDEPSPVLAAILGFIPGVGAMYNGQFGKGVVHLIIFAVLVSLSNLNGIFGLFVAGWIFYMVFEAYHTAVARRDGLPLPNPFGFNDIAERMGFPRAWPTSPNPSAGAARPNPAAPSAAAPNVGAAYSATNPVPAASGPDWVGYVPPSAFASATPTYSAPYSAPPYAAASYVPPSAAPIADPGAAPIADDPRAQATPPIPGYSPAYKETFTGTDAGIAGVSPGLPTRRFPVGAIWLIGLGVLILLANLLPDWQLTERWWPPVLLAGLALWTFTRRLGSGVRLICILRWPVILMLLAVIQALHAADYTITLGTTCALLLIVLGVLLLLERTLGSSPVYPPAAGYTAPSGSVFSDAGAPARTSWSAPGAAAAPSEPAATAPDAEGSRR